jgi:hypothetical protein
MVPTNKLQKRYPQVRSSKGSIKKAAVKVSIREEQRRNLK